MRDPEGKTRAEDVDDVIGIAAEMMQRDAETISTADLHAVGAELDVPAETIERARHELERRRAEETRVAMEVRIARRRLAVVGGAGSAALLLILAVWSGAAVSSLRDRHTVVQARAAQVENVRARRTSVTELLAGRPASPDTDAERIGAENRVRVETQRYVEAAAAYNDAASSFPASWVVPLVDLPAAVPLDP